MSDLKTKMHQIRYWPGSAPYHAGRAYSAPNTPRWIYLVLLLRGGEWERRGWRGKKKGKGISRGWNEMDTPLLKFLNTPLVHRERTPQAKNSNLCDVITIPQHHGRKDRRTDRRLSVAIGGIAYQ